MKIATENNVKQFVLNKINKVYIGFNDNVEVKLDNIIDYDISLYNDYDSTIGFTNAFENIEIINHFGGGKLNRIIYIKIYGTAFITDKYNFGETIKVFYDIPCDMSISSLMLNGGIKECSNMFVELEGLVK